jgi:hypothetical protein
MCLIVNRYGLFESEQGGGTALGWEGPHGGMMPYSKHCLAAVCEQRRAGYSWAGCMGLVLVKDCCALQRGYLLSNVAAFPWFCFLCLCLAVLVMCLTI